MGKIKEELVTFGKAELTASCASVVDFGLAFFLSDIIGIYYGLANALGVISGGITNCILNYRYVFGDSKSKKKECSLALFYHLGHQLDAQFGRHYRPDRISECARTYSAALYDSEEYCISAGSDIR